MSTEEHNQVSSYICMCRTFSIKMQELFCLSSRVFIRHWRSENSPSTYIGRILRLNFARSLKELHSFIIILLLPLHCSPVTTILNENPVVVIDYFYNNN